MTADEREREIESLRDALIEVSHEIESLTARLSWRRTTAIEMQADLARLIAQRTPAEVEQMERERGLR